MKKYPSLRTFFKRSLLFLLILTTAVACKQKKNSQAAEENTPAADTAKSELCVGAYLTPEQAREKLKEYAATYSDAAGWKARAQKIRENIIRGGELDLIPKEEWDYPIKVIHGAKHKMNGYTIENIALEIKPDYYVHGNLYLPDKIEGKIPAILNPHGHWFDPGDYGRFRADMQYRCGSFARMGAVAFAWDMFGTGEDIYHKHLDPKALKYQTFNSIRVLDYISSLDFVDTNRIAVTGASGGGTQTFLLAAVDPRVDVSVPVVMVSAYFFGGCVCESGMPIHKHGSFSTDNAEIAATVAPKPLLIVSDGDDWTQHVPTLEYPYIKHIYAMFGAEDNVENAHFPNEVHDYGFSKRKAVYPFMAKHLGLNLSAIEDEQGNITEKDIMILDTTALKVYPDRNLAPDPFKEKEKEEKENK